MIHDSLPTVAATAMPMENSTQGRKHAAGHPEGAGPIGMPALPSRPAWAGTGAINVSSTKAVLIS